MESLHALVGAGGGALVITMGWNHMIARLKNLTRKRVLEQPPVAVQWRDVLTDACRHRQRFGIYCSRPRSLSEEARGKLQEAFRGYAYMLRLRSQQDARELLDNLLDGEIVMFVRDDHAHLVYDFLADQGLSGAGSYLCLACPSKGVIKESKARLGNPKERA